MSYLVLARRFRPQTFASIVGQEHISTALANAIARNRLPHALLLCGPRGVGKTTTARVLARALNCTGRVFPENISSLAEIDARNAVEPCGECTNCVEIARSVSLAVQEVDGASNNSVDNVRELIESLKGLPPPGCKYKIYIIDEVHMLSTAAFNALLKSLEEPPPHTIFMFATTDPQKVPETVISRCQLFEFRRLPSSVIVSGLADILQSEKVVVEPAVLHFIARRADGGMRDAQSMLDRLLAFSAEEISLGFAQEIFGAVDREILHRLASDILRGNPEGCLSTVGEVFGRSVDTKQFLADFIEMWRDLLVLSTVQRSHRSEVAKTFERTQDEIRELESLVDGKESFDLERLFRLANETVESALISSFPRFVMEAGVVRMALLPSLKPIAQFLSGNATPQTAGRSGEGTYSQASPPIAPPASQAQPSTTKPVATRAPIHAEQFNPSWVDFVKTVRTSSEQVLAAFLRRVSPLKFSDRVLELGGNSFDLEALQEAGTRATLVRLLENYSGHDGWKISFIPTERQAPDGLSPEVLSSNESPRPGKSIAEEEAEMSRSRVARVNEEAKNHPLIQSALSTFQGSKIDRISVLDEDR